MSATAEQHWYDLAYWQANFPQVRLNPADNPHVQPARILRVPWTSADVAPPIVAVEFLPRVLPHEDRPGGLTWLPIVTAVVGIIPGVGSLVKAALTAANIGAGVGQMFALQEWAKSFKASPDEFSPQYSPQAFTVPMPLDRAQLMVAHPWYAPAMVYQFAQELQTGQLRPTAMAYANLLQMMLAPGQADPPAYTGGQASLFWFANPFALEALPYAEAPAGQAVSQAAVTTSGLSAGGTPAARSGGVLPFLVAAGLLVAGAPVAVPIAIVVLATKR